jgi:hypothetical protein
MEDFKLLAFEERLSDRTMIERRNLLIAACAGLIYNAGLPPVGEILGMTVASTSMPARQMVTGAFGWAVGYLLVMFLLYLWSDHRRYRLAIRLPSMDGLHKAIDDVHTEVEVLSAQKRQRESQERRAAGLPHIDDKGVSYKASPEWQKEHYLEQLVSKMKSEVSAASRIAQGITADEGVSLTASRLRFCIVDVGVPLLLGVFALYKLSTDLVPFAMKVWDSP